MRVEASEIRRVDKTPGTADRINMCLVQKLPSVGTAPVQKLCSSKWHGFINNGKTSLMNRVIIGQQSVQSTVVEEPRADELPHKIERVLY